MTYYRYRFSFGYGLTPVVKNLMIVMGSVFILQMLSPDGLIFTSRCSPHGLEEIFSVAACYLHFSSWRTLSYSLQPFSPLYVWRRVRKLLGIEEVFTIFSLLRNWCRYLHGDLFSISIRAYHWSFRSHLRDTSRLWVAFPQSPYLTLFPPPHTRQILRDHLRSHRTLLLYARNRRRRRTPHPFGWSRLRYLLYGLSSDPAKNSS